MLSSKNAHGITLAAALILQGTPSGCNIDNPWLIYLQHLEHVLLTLS